MMETPSIGVDADGQRHWLLKVCCNSLCPLSLSLSHTHHTHITYSPCFFSNNVLLSVHFEIPLGLKF